MKISSLLKSSVLNIFMILLFSGSWLTAQDITHTDYRWDEEATQYELPDSLSEEGAVYTKFHLLLEFNPDLESSNNLFVVEHWKLYLNSDKAIEANNKIYIPTEEKNDKYNEIKIRVIQPDGKIVLLNNKNIKTGTHADSGQEYAYYAIEGLQKGSAIEAVIKSQVYPSFYGRMYYIQKEYPIYDYHFQYIAPDFMELAFKTYNTKNKVVMDELEEHTIYKLTADYVQKYTAETLSNSGSNKEYFVYKLDKNLAQNTYDINGYRYYSQVIGKRGLNAHLTKTAFSSIASTYDKIGIEESDTDRVKVLKIENYLKQNFSFIDNNSEQSLEDVDAIFQQKAMNNFGAMRLYIELLYNAGMTCEVIATCDKTRLAFDEDFETYLFLNKILLYIPEIKTALDPSDRYSRLQYFSPEYQGHPGLYIKSRTIGETTTATGKVKMIPTTKGAENLNKATINVNILEDFEDIEIDVASEKTGMRARDFQPYFGSVEDEFKEDFYTYAMHTYSDQLIMSSLKFENTEALDFPQRPLKATCKLYNEDFWQKAGNNYILNTGALIGPQSQMYNEEGDKRRTPINSQYARRFQYEINFNIPDNYEVNNLGDLDMVVDGTNGEYTFYFKSKHELDGNKVKVTVDELYDHDLYPAEQFTAYQKVINAAADFSKVKIIFKPK